jgi:hypothetical protein
MRRNNTWNLSNLTNRTPPPKSSLQLHYRNLWLNRNRGQPVTEYRTAGGEFLSYIDSVNQIKECDAELAQALSEVTNLDRALRKLEQLRFRMAEMDVIAQDEFSHDVLIPFAEGERYLVLGVT